MCEKKTEKQEQLKIFSEEEFKKIEQKTGTEIVDTLQQKPDGVQLKIEFPHDKH